MAAAIFEFSKSKFDSSRSSFYDTEGAEKHQKIGAKVLSARLARVLNLMITSLTKCFCNARGHVAKSGEIRQRTTNRGITK